LKEYGLDQCDVVDIPMDTSFNQTAFADADHAVFQDSKKSTLDSAQFLEEKLILWMQSQLTNYGFDHNKIPLYSDSRNIIALSCKIVQHSKTKHIVVCYHFIKEIHKVVNRVTLRLTLQDVSALPV
nr:hypothetical protein [Tanacetum cinerariifolium]